MLKKSILFLLVILLLFTGTTLALDGVTGSEWQEFSEEEKEVYVEGWIEGFNMAIIIIAEDIQTDVDVDLLAEQLRREGVIQTGEEAEEIKKNIINTLNEDLKEDQTMFDLYVEDELNL